VSLAAAGVDLALAPVVDVNSNPDNPVIGVRSFGADPGLVARHTTAFVRGLQSVGVGACVKHFPGHGDTAVDSHLALPTVDASSATLMARELVPFRAAVTAGAVAVMTSHVVVPAWDAALPATLSPTVLSLLRADLGFAGLLVSDAVDMKAVAAGRAEPSTAVLALAAGCDLICLGADKGEDLHLAVVAAIVGAVRAGALPEQRLAEAAERVRTAAATVGALGTTVAERGSDAAASNEVARRALSVDGSLPELVRPVVLRLRTASNVAVGEVPWGLPPDGAVLAGRPVVDVQRTTTLDQVLAEVGSAPVVALVREAHRHAWVLDLLHGLAAACPGLVVVEMGWPGKDRLPGAAVVTTYGASRANGAALDRLLSAP
jgi:beta-N-acetylhexosaminidase